MSQALVALLALGITAEAQSPSPPSALAPQAPTRPRFGLTRQDTGAGARGSCQPLRGVVPEYVGLERVYTLAEPLEELFGESAKDLLGYLNGIETVRTQCGSRVFVSLRVPVRLEFSSEAAATKPAIPKSSASSRRELPWVFCPRSLVESTEDVAGDSADYLTDERSTPIAAERPGDSSASRGSAEAAWVEGTPRAIVLERGLRFDIEWVGDEFRISFAKHRDSAPRVEFLTRFPILGGVPIARSLGPQLIPLTLLHATLDTKRGVAQVQGEAGPARFVGEVQLVWPTPGQRSVLCVGPIRTRPWKSLMQSVLRDLPEELGDWLQSVRPGAGSGAGGAVRTQ